MRIARYLGHAHRLHELVVLIDRVDVDRPTVQDVFEVTCDSRSGSELGRRGTPSSGIRLRKGDRQANGDKRGGGKCERTPKPTETTPTQGFEATPLSGWRLVTYCLTCWPHPPPITR